MLIDSFNKNMNYIYIKEAVDLSQDEKKRRINRIRSNHFTEIKFLPQLRQVFDFIDG